MLAGSAEKVFAYGGPQSGFSSPDNLTFDPYGNLWMVTDISSSRVGKGIYSFQGNNAMFFFPTFDDTRRFSPRS